MPKIARIEHIHGDAGFRRACFLKITTDDGIVGWSEYSEHTGTAGVTGVIAALGELLIGMDALAVDQVAAFLRARTIQAGGGVNQHAIAALTNALLDIKGKALGVPVHSLFGGPYRARLPLYWSHCGTYRVRHAGLFDAPPLATVLGFALKPTVALGCALTDTVADCTALPPAPVQLSI